MEQEISKSQIDRLGERLKHGKTEDDLRLLEKYRHSFRTAHEFVYKEIREKLSLEPTKRLTKTTQSIVDKLLRLNIKLAKFQDIAGCRIVTKSIADQNKIVDQLKTLFDDYKIKDRREKPSHGYRAVHVIVFVSGKAVEIQVRTALQHLWAEISEKCADQFDRAIKYGGGVEVIQESLLGMSRVIADTELDNLEIEKELNELEKLLNQEDQVLQGLSNVLKRFESDLLHMQSSFVSRISLETFFQRRKVIWMRNTISELERESSRQKQERDFIKKQQLHMQEKAIISLREGLTSIGELI